MAKKQIPQPDVVVLGGHPAAYLTAALLRHKTKLEVTHATLPGETISDRLVLINPAFFSLHPLLEPLKRKLELNAVYGLRFFSDDPAVHSESRRKQTMAYVGSLKEIRTAMAKIAESEGVELVTPKTLEVLHLDETGVDLTFGKNSFRTTVMAIAGSLPIAQQKLIGMPEAWEREIVHRYTYLKIAETKCCDLGNRPTVPMSLNLKGELCWGWLLPGPKSLQLAVEQPIETVGRVSAADLLAHWIEVLRANNVITSKAPLALESAESITIPMGGALIHEGVANRTVLVGPAGGFYSACAEDIYPNCWSALFAADAIKKALKEPHLQDALNPYRLKWRTTLGDYLRGPQQNLKFLLPLVYRNPVMTDRLTDAILLGKSVIR